MFFVVGGLMYLWPDLCDARDEGRLTVLVNASGRITEDWVRTKQLPDLTTTVSWRKGFFHRKTDIAHVFAICDESRNWLAERGADAYALVYYPTNFPVEQPIDLIVRAEGPYLESPDGEISERADLRGMIVVRLLSGGYWRIPQDLSDEEIAPAFLSVRTDLQ